MSRYCPVHPSIELKWIPAGVSKSSGKPYPSFPVCGFEGCKQKLLDNTVPLSTQEPLDQAIAKAQPTYNHEDKPKEPDWDAKERRMVRMNSWSHATELIVHLFPENKAEDQFEATVKIAHQIEDDIYRGFEEKELVAEK